MALFWGIQEYFALDANNITLVFDSGKSLAIYSCIPLKAIQYYINIGYKSITLFKSFQEVFKYELIKGYMLKFHFDSLNIKWEKHIQWCL